MKKDDFLRFINFEDTAAVLRLYDKLCLFERTGKNVYSNEFFTPVVWTRLSQLSSSFGADIVCEGIFEEAERRMIGICGERCCLPLKALCITNKSKFQNLQHKDYLGAVMSLGIKREKIGDFVVEGSMCFCAVSEDVAQYIIDNLSSVANCPCETLEINDRVSLPKYNFEEKVVITTSMRADCVVGAIIGQSRSRSVEMIKSGKVLINYEDTREKDMEVTPSSTLTIRGYGKFKIGEIVGSSGSGRLKISVKKFV